MIQQKNDKEAVDALRDAYSRFESEIGKAIVGQNKVIDYIMEYLKEYNSDNKFSYIFSYSFGGGLLYASDALDITTEVMEGINKKYQTEKSSK